MRDSILWTDFVDEEYEKRLDATGIDPDDFDACEKLYNDVFYEWNLAVMNEPAMVALSTLADEEEAWIGTEDDLFEKVGELAGEKARKSGPFPSTPQELMEHIRDVDEHSLGFSTVDFRVRDRRKLTDDEANEYRAPGWDHASPILVHRLGAAMEPNYWSTLMQLARYQKVFLIAVLKSTRNQPYWSGTTRQLHTRLWAYYPDNRPEGMGWMFRVDEMPEGFEKCVARDMVADAAYKTPYSNPRDPEDPDKMFDYFLDEWIGSKDDYSEHLRSMSLLELYRLMIRYSPILKEFGIEVTGKKPSPTESTVWTIEAPPWSFTDRDDIVITRQYMYYPHWDE